MSARDELIDEYGRADTAPLGTLSDLKQRLDACRAEVLAEEGLLPKADVVAWLVKKAREGTPVEVLASKVARGAVRPDNLRMLPNPGFFEPGRTYARKHRGRTVEFHVRYVDTAPDCDFPTAFGWRKDPELPALLPMDSDDMDGWTDITETVQGGEAA